MQIIFMPDGNARAIYAESIDLAQLGAIEVRRASHVEPDGAGGWFADLSPVGGPVLRGFRQRSEALAAEVNWLNEHWLHDGAQNRSCIMPEKWESVFRICDNSDRPPPAVRVLNLVNGHCHDFENRADAIAWIEGEAGTPCQCPNCPPENRPTGKRLNERSKQSTVQMATHCQTRRRSEISLADRPKEGCRQSIAPAGGIPASHGCGPICGRR